MKKIPYLTELLEDLIFNQSDLYEEYETSEDECPEERLKIKWGGSMVAPHSRQLVVMDEKDQPHYFKVTLTITKSRKSQ